MYEKRISTTGPFQVGGPENQVPGPSTSTTPPQQWLSWPRGSPGALKGTRLPKGEQLQVTAQSGPLQVDSSEQAGNQLLAQRACPVKVNQPFPAEKGQYLLECPTRKAETHEEKEGRKGETMIDGSKHTDLRPSFLGLKKAIYQ